MTGPTQLNNTLNVSSNAGISSNLTVLGSTVLGSNLRVNAATLLNSSLTVANASPSILTGSLRVDGIATLNSLGVTNNLNLSGTLTVGGLTQLNNTLNVAGNTGIVAGLTVTGTTQLNNTLNVTGQLGIGTTTPQPSSILDVSSTTKGLLVPRMTEIQKNAISTPAEGLLLYQTDVFNGFYYRDSPSWLRILSTSDNISFEIGSVKVGTTSYGLQNTQLGDDTFNFSTSGSNNTAIGFFAISSSNGSDNTALGTNAMRQGQGSVDGSFNTAIGASALAQGDDGGYNTGIGASSIKRVEGDNNSGLGYRTLFSTTTGDDNTAVGYNAGDTNTTGSNNTLIGSSADVSSNNLTNATAIGANATINASNKIQLGDTNITNVGTSGTITAGAITIPNTDGTANQVLETDGSGILSWITPFSGVTEVTDEFTATASQTIFTLTQTPPSNSKVKMFVNGVRISNTAYSWSGTTLTYVPVNNSGYSLINTDRVQFDYFY